MGKYFTWEIRWAPSLPLFYKDNYRDGGSKTWHVFPITVCKWIHWDIDKDRK